MVRSTYMMNSGQVTGIWMVYSNKIHYNKLWVANIFSETVFRPSRKKKPKQNNKKKKSSPLKYQWVYIRIHTRHKK